jgi:hypothetical protein
MTRYLFYSNPSRNLHVIERINDEGVSRLTSHPDSTGWNKRLSDAHALFRLVGMVNDGAAMETMEDDLEEIFLECEDVDKKKNEDKEN